MASLKDQLDAAGYDVSGLDEAAVLKQLDADGYDVSQFHAAAPKVNYSDLVKSPAAQLAEAAPSKVFPALGAAGANAPGAGLAVLGSLIPGGNPADVAAGARSLMSDPGQLKRGIQRGLAVWQGSDPTENEKAATTIGKVGGAALEGFMPVEGVLPQWAESLLQGWSEKAANVAVGVVGRVAKAMGVDDLSAIAQFLLKPITLGGTTYDPIVTPLASPEAMKASAEAIKTAAGKALDSVDDTMDGLLAKDSSKLDVNGIVAELNKAKSVMMENHPRAGKAVVDEFQKHIDDLLDVLTGKNAREGLFSAVRDFKTTLGDLIQNFESNAPVKAAAQRVYGTVAGALDKAAQAADQATGNAFKQANQTYTWIVDIVSALEGKVAKSPSLLTDIPSMGAGIIAGLTNPIAAIPTFAAAHFGRKYGPQLVASALRPTVDTAAELGAKSLPVVGNLISRALQSPDE